MGGLRIKLPMYILWFGNFLDKQNNINSHSIERILSILLEDTLYERRLFNPN